MKPVVKYKHDLNNFIELGMNALVFPLDHPSPYVSNQYLVRTSKVIKLDKETGNFETVNTIYEFEKGE